VRGFVIRELSGRVSNFRAADSLESYLDRNGIIGIEGIDTRALVRLTRERGALKGILSTTDLDDASLVAKAQASPGLVGRDLAREVMPSGVTTWDHGLDTTYRLPALAGEAGESGHPHDPADPRCPHVVALDFGMKWNILRHLVDLGCKVTVMPGSATADEILDFDPDGIFISNGPGDPRPLADATSTLRTLIRTAAGSRGIPIFGICLGHQLLGQAFGARTFKLKFGHRGANHPVRDQRSGKVEITTQNHGFAVDPATLPTDVEPSHVNLNDQTLEGLRHKRLPIFSVQYHPEASAGPHDSAYLFDEFRRLIREHS
jgi:carbamoyl-phosphate synthase small subunit